ncbi:hypothetical protein CcI49_32985 [Frankia sp. CcI49]|nr:hypothetical protein CcI49_32985 [Frankia sp. CcI49]
MRRTWLADQGPPTVVRRPRLFRALAMALVPRRSRTYRSKISLTIVASVASMMSFLAILSTW